MTLPASAARDGTARIPRVGAVLREAVACLAAAGIATAHQDAELLLVRVLGRTRLALHLEPRAEIEAPAVARFDALVTRRAGHEPLQYILGETEFSGLRLAVGPGAFIPRPETELLAERALAACPAGAPVAVELGAGSGALACVLAARQPALSVWAVELSPAALAWARENVRQLGLDARVTLVEGDLFAPLAGRGLGGRCDVVVANPPYIAHAALADLPDEVARWEPAIALDGGPDGTAVIARIVRDAPDFLRPGGTLLLEIGHDQAPRVRAGFAADSRYGPPRVCRDFRGYERVLEARRA